MRIHRSQLNQVPRDTPPKSRNSPRDEKEGSRGKRLLTSRFQSESQGLPGQLWRWEPNRKRVEQIVRPPNLIPFLTMPGRRQLILANIAIDQRRIKSQRFKHRPSQRQAIGEPMKRARPNPSTETFSTLVKHDHPRHVNYLETIIQFYLEQPNLFDRSVQAGRGRRSRRRHPTRSKLIYEIEHRGTGYFLLHLLAEVEKGELQSAQLLPIRGELVNHGRPLPLPHLEMSIWKTQSAARPSATPVTPVRNQGGRAARLGKTTLGLPTESPPPFQVLS
jgi:hypothetical protein